MGTLFGFAVGYVLGARAGNPGYERLQEAWNDLRNSREFQAFFDAARSHLQGSLRIASERLGEPDQLLAQGEDLLARARSRVEGAVSSDPS